MRRSRRELLAEIERVLAAKPRLAPRGRVSQAKAGTEERPLPGHASPLDRVALLAKSPQYLHVSIYVNGGARLVRLAAAGATAECTAMDCGQGVVGKVAESGRERVIDDVTRDPDYFEILHETRSELVVPAKIGNHVLAVIDVESGRAGAFAYDDLVLLRRTAEAVAKFLAGEGRYLMLEARETAADHLRPRFQSHPRPTPASPGVAWATHHAAAGERTRS